MANDVTPAARDVVEGSEVLEAVLWAETSALRQMCALLEAERHLLAEFRMDDYPALLDEKETHLQRVSALARRRAELLGQLMGPALGYGGDRFTRLLSALPVDAAMALDEARAAAVAQAVALSQENAALAALVGRLVEIAGVEGLLIQSLLGQEQYDPSGHVTAVEVARTGFDLHV